MKPSTLVIAVLLVLSGVQLGKRYLQKKEMESYPKYGNYLSCNGKTEDIKVKFRSSVLLVKDALPETDEEKNFVYQGAIFFQNLYTFTNLQWQHPELIKGSTIVEKNPKMTVLSIEETPFPYEFEFDKDVTVEGFFPAPTNYMQKLQGMGTVPKGTTAIKVNYEYENILYLCLTAPAKQVLSKVRFIQPVDGFGAYFVVPLKDRRPIHNPARETTQIVNPCVDPGGIPPTSLSPFGAWYFWKPETEGRDAQGKEFNCKDYYKEGVSLNRITPEFSENPPKDVKEMDFAAFDFQDRPIEISLFIGARESSLFPKFHEDEVKKYVVKYLSDEDINKASRELPFHQKKYDIAFSTALWFIKSIKGHMELKSHETKVSDYLAEITLKGKLKLSKKDVSLTVVVAPNNKKYPGADSFSQAFAEHFLKSDLVMYEGHVTAGTVFNDSFGKYKDLLTQSQNKKIKYQLFAINSCSSEYFFRPETFPKIDHPGFKRDVITTGSAYFDSSAKSSLLLMAQLDGFLYNGSYVPFAYWAKASKSDNFYILGNY